MIDKKKALILILLAFVSVITMVCESKKQIFFATVLETYENGKGCLIEMEGTKEWYFMSTKFRPNFKAGERIRIEGRIDKSTTWTINYKKIYASNIPTIEPFFVEIAKPEKEETVDLQGATKWIKK